MYYLVMKNMLHKYRCCEILPILISHLDYVGLLEAQKKQCQSKLMINLVASQFLIL